MAFSTILLDFSLLKKFDLKRKIKVYVLRFLFILRNVCDLHRHIHSVFYRVAFSSMRSSSRLDTLPCIYYTDALTIVLGSDFAWVAPNGVAFKLLNILSCFIPCFQRLVLSEKESNILLGSVSGVQFLHSGVS